MIEVAEQQELIPVENENIMRLVKDSQLEKTKAQKVLEQFTAFFDEASKWEADVKGLVITDVSQTLEMQTARDARLALKDIRIGAEKTKKKLKENILIEGRFIDGIYAAVVAVTKPLEDDLLEKENFVERKEEVRLEKIRLERVNALQKYEVETEFYDLVNMSEGGFDQLLQSSKIAYDQRIEAERKAEVERVEQAEAEWAERERMRQENLRLKKEAEAKEKELAKERAEAEKTRKAIEQKAEAERVELEKIKAAEKKQYDDELRKIQDEKDAIIRQEKARQEAAANEKKEREAKESAEKKAKEETARAAALAPDKTKLVLFCDTILSLERPRLEKGVFIEKLDGLIQAVTTLKKLVNEIK